MQTLSNNYALFGWLENIPFVSKYFEKRREQKLQRTIEKQIGKLEQKKAELERANLQLIKQHSSLNQSEKNDPANELEGLSHDLRTPLTAILGFAQLLLRNAEKDNLSVRQRKGLERIASNAENLLLVVNRFLDNVSVKTDNKIQDSEAKNVNFS